jgi:hypothetical protein
MEMTNAVCLECGLADAYPSYPLVLIAVTAVIEGAEHPWCRECGLWGRLRVRDLVERWMWGLPYLWILWFIHPSSFAHIP